MILVSPKVNLQYWTQESDIKNLGDYLGPIMLEYAGIRIRPEGRCCFTIGTVLSGSWWNLTRGPRLIWGSGACGFDLPFLEGDEVLAVRGPLTAQWLGVDVPLGDPALLFPRIYQPPKNTRPPIIVLNHANSHLLVDENFTSMKVHQAQWKSVMIKITTAEFVLANSLHSSILAMAYNRPWAVYEPIGGTFPLPLRWNDWFAYLGLPSEAWQPVNNFDDGWRWWEKWRKCMKMRSLNSLIDCCPWPALRRAIQ